MHTVTAKHENLDLSPKYKRQSFWRQEAQNLDQEKYTSACDTRSCMASNCQVKTFFTSTVDQYHKLPVVCISQQCPTYGLQAEPTAFGESTRSPFTLAQSIELGFPFETVLVCMATELPNAKWKWHRRALHQLFQVKDWGVKILLLDTQCMPAIILSCLPSVGYWGVRGDTTEHLKSYDHWTSTQNATYSTEGISSYILL